MTISYTSEVPNGSSFGCFWRILLKWRGSVYKLVWRELLAYLCLYYSINLIYRYVLHDDQKRVFATIRMYFGQQSESIPMSFVLGFYVSLVVKRWWEQYRLLPWPDTLALFISAALPGNDETGRLMRRNIMRYAVLAYVITLQRISLRVKRRFPGWQHLVDAGLLLESERKIFEIFDGKSPMSKYWMPLVWATNIINRARKENLITSDHIVQTLLMELSDIRRRLGALIGYDTVCVPLVYTQVVTLVLYTYFIAALMGRQMIPEINSVTGKMENPDLYFPLFTALQFCFYVGWLKVAEVLINPFGEDDDDIELNWLIDRHIKASYMIVDEMHEEHPELLKDQYWEEVVPKDLPYTVASEHYRKDEPKGSAERYKVKEADAVYANIINPTGKRNLHDDVYADYESVDTPMVERRSKSWFHRQINRMGSIRSSSTAYSSGGLFARNRHNSVYSSPEAGLAQAQPSLHKMTLYDKFVNRKSGRSLQQRHQLIKQSSKLSLNGSVASAVPFRNRPRIPTPDVTKEQETSRSHTTTNQNAASNIPSVASGVALMAHQLANTPSMYPTSINNSDVSVVGTLLLSPIKELDSISVNNTLQAGHSATTALAQAILPASLKSAGLNPSSSLTSLAIQFARNSPINTRSNINNNTNTVFVLSTSSVASPTTTTAVSSDIQKLFPQDLLSLSVQTLPMTLSLATTTNSSSAASNGSGSGGVVITELPLDQPDSVPATITLAPAPETLAQAAAAAVVDEVDNGSAESRGSLAGSSKNATPEPASGASTLTKRPTNHSEVYV